MPVIQCRPTHLEQCKATGVWTCKWLTYSASFPAKGFEQLVDRIQSAMANNEDIELTLVKTKKPNSYRVTQMHISFGEAVKRFEDMSRVRWSSVTISAEQRSQIKTGQKRRLDQEHSDFAQEKLGLTKVAHMRKWAITEDAQNGLERVIQNPFIGVDSDAYSCFEAMKIAVRLKTSGHHDIESFLVEKSVPYLASLKIKEMNSSGIGLTEFVDFKSPVCEWIHATIAKHLDVKKTRFAPADIRKQLESLDDFIIQDETLFLARRHAVEEELARLLGKRIAATVTTPTPKASGHPDSDFESTDNDSFSDSEVFSDSDFEPAELDSFSDSEVLSESQASAVRKMLCAYNRRGLAVVCGAAGTGKTRTTSAFIGSIPNLNTRSDGCGVLEFSTVLVTSLTHKALSRSEAVLRSFSNGVSFSTIARLRHLAKKPRASVLIVEECSMVGVEDMIFLLDTFHDSAVVFVGDPVQLPSISWGESFRDTCNIVKGLHDGICFEELRSVHRNSGEILELASAMRQVICAPPSNRKPLLALVHEALACSASGIQVLGWNSFSSEKLAALYADRLFQVAEEKSIPVTEAQKYVQILSPNRKQNMGRPNTEDINTAVINELIKRNVVSFADPKTEDFPLCDGEKVIVKDKIDRRVSRNEFAILKQTEEGGQVWIETLDDKWVRVPLSCLRRGHAETFHSYQGDEVEHIIMAVNQKSYPCNARMLYTGITRAQKTVTILDIRPFTDMRTYGQKMWRTSALSAP